MTIHCDGTWLAGGEAKGALGGEAKGALGREA